MKKVTFLLLLIFVSACSVNEDAPSESVENNQNVIEIRKYDSIEKTIEQGLKKEVGQLLAKESLNEETIVLFLAKKSSDQPSLGIASITEDEDGFSWYRSSSTYNISKIEDDEPAGLIAISLKTENGLEYNVLTGVVKNDEAKNVIVNINDQSHTLDIHESGIFYYITDEKISRSKVVEVI